MAKITQGIGKKLNVMEARASISLHKIAQKKPGVVSTLYRPKPLKVQRGKWQTLIAKIYQPEKNVPCVDCFFREKVTAHSRSAEPPWVQDNYV